VSAGIACRLCTDWPPGFAGVRSAVWLDDGARRAVHLLKYEGWWRVAHALADVVARRLPIPRKSVLVPIPLSPARLKARGYNQSAVLARALAESAGLAVQPDALARRRHTETQTALTPEERRANLAGAFMARGPAPAYPVLVDDVFTTGSTLAEAARALAAGGAQQITAVTFARALRPLAHAAGS
jgi:ComF family protein